MRDVPIYTKTLREYCVKKPKKKSRDPLTIHVMGKLSDFMMGRSMPVKYEDPGNPILTVHINGVEIQNVLVDLGAAINVITAETPSVARDSKKVRHRSASSYFDLTLSVWDGKRNTEKRWNNPKLQQEWVDGAISCGVQASLMKKKQEKLRWPLVKWVTKNV